MPGPGRPRRTASSGGASNSSSAAKPSTPATSTTRRTPRRGAAAAAAAAAAPASPASGSEDKDKSPTRRRSTRDRATKNYKEPSLDVDGESGDEDADTSGSEGGKNASIKKKTAAKQDAKSQQRRPKKRAASTGTAMNEPSSRPKRRRGSTGDVGISKKAGDAKQTKTTTAVSGAAARKTRVKPSPKPGAGRGGRPRGAKARASEKMEVDDDDDDDDVDEEEDFDDEEEDEDVVNDIIDGAEDEEDDDDDDEEDDDDDLDDLGDDDLDEMEDGDVEGHGEDGVVELKVEKLLAHHRKTKGEWIAFCKGQTTSRVLNGRRREMLAFELSSGDNASKADDDDNDGRNSLGGIAKRMRRLPKLSKKKLRKQETRYLVKWLNNAFIHVSWETAKGLRAFFGDNAMVDRHLRKLENSFAMMDAEELSDLQQVDRLVDYNTFVEDDEDEGENGSEGKSATQDKQGDADEGTTKKGQNKKTDSKKGSGENGAPASAKKQKGSESAKKQKEAVSWEYLVKWKSQGYEDATWELWSDIKDHPDIDAKLKLHDLRNSVAYRRNRNKVGSQELDYSSARTFKNGRKLRSYQVEAVTWLAVNFSSERNSILADEMGLGKTCQTVTFTHRLRHQFNRNGPFLVVAPLATLPHWQREFEAWTDFNCLTYHGSAEGRELIRSKEFFWDDGRSIMKGPGGLPKFDALVTNYETVLSDASMLRRFKWDLLIVDEAHRLKNRDSKLTVCLRESFKYRASLLLTGTPIQNSLPELWTLLNFIAPEDFASLDAFKEKFGNMQTAEEMDRFHARLRPYMLRRIKSEVEPLPEREDTMIEVELTTMQKRFYRAIYEKNTEYLLAGVVKGARVSLNNVAMELRKCCCHPYLIDGVESKVLKDDPPPRTATSEERSSHVFDKLINASGKLILLDKLLPKLKAEGHRVLIFSQMTRMLDILEDYLLHRSYAYERIDGSVRGVDRQFAIDRFSSKNSQAFAFLLSTRGCGQGINLTAADTVIMYDGDWNPQNDVQALARCHRIGQTKRVKVYRLITRKTYEYTMFERASMKLGLDHAVMSGITKEDGTDKSGKSPRAKAKSKREQDLETERLLKFGAYALTADGDDDAATQQFMNANIDEILSSRAKLMATSKEDNQLSKATFVASDNDTNLDINDPEFWTKVVGLQAKNEDDEDDEDDGDRRSRRRGKNKVNYAGNGFAAMGFDDDDDDDDVDDDDDEEEDVEEPRKDEDENGRKLWQRKHFQVLLSAIQKFGYGRWERLFADVNGRFPDRFTRSDVENAARGFLIFCIFKREESKKKKINDDPSVASPAGDDSDDSDDDDDDDESETQEVSDTGRLSDFQLVNMTHAQLVEGIRSRTSHIEFNDTHRRLIDELTQGADWIVPDVLVTRRRILPSSMNELPKATTVKKEEGEEKKMKKEGEEEEEKKEGEGSSAIKAEGGELAQKDGGTVKSEDAANASQSADAKGAAAIDTKKEGEGKEGKEEEEEEKQGGDEDEEPFKLEDSDSDDSDLEGEAREEHRQMRRGYAYNERVAARTMDAAAKYLRIFEKHASMQSILNKYTDGDRLLVEEFPQIPGIPPVVWWAPQDDLTLIKGLYDHGWDPRRSNATFSAIRKDGSLRFSKNPPMKDDDDADDDDEGGPEKNKKANAKTGSKEDPSAPAKNGDGKVEEAKATEANAEGDAKAKSEPKTVVSKDGDAEMKDAADEAAGAPAGKSDADGDATMGEASDKATGDDEASRTPPRPVDTDSVWPRNHKLGLRAKRVVDWFSAQTRKTRRAEETQKRREARKEAKRLAKAKPKSKGPTVSPNWMRTELKALFKTLIRWGVPSEKPLDPKWRMSYAQLMQHAGLKRKTQAMVESQVKLLVQDAVQLRLRPDMNIERSKAIMGSTGSARKMMERIKVLRDLRGIVLTANDETLLRIISRFEKQLRSKKRTRMPEWWKSEHDLAMLKGASRHGIGNFLATDAIRSDPEFPFHTICNVTTGAAQSQAREKALLAKKEKKASQADQGADKANENGNDEDDDDEDEDNVNEDDDEDEDAKPVSSVGANSEKANGVEDNAKGGNDKTIADDGKANAGDGSDSNEEGKHAFPSVVMFLNRLRTIVELVARSQRSSMLNHAFTSQSRTTRTPVQRKLSDFMNGNVQAKSETVDLTETKAHDAATSTLASSSSSSSSSSSPSPKLGKA